MKNIIKPAHLIFIILLCIGNSCKKEELPVVSTSLISNITATTASSGGNITSDGGAEVTTRGICFSSNPKPTITGLKTNDGAGIGQFTSELTELMAGVTYFVRAYATNSEGTAYGSDIAFTTSGQAPDATTLTVCCIKTNGATLNGAVNANDLSATVTFEYGTTTAYGSSVDAVPGSVSGNNSTSVSADISELNFGTIYHFRIKAINALGTMYGNDLSFTTLSQAPTATTQQACIHVSHRCYTEWYCECQLPDNNCHL